MQRHLLPLTEVLIRISLGLGLPAAIMLIVAGGYNLSSTSSLSDSNTVQFTVATDTKDMLMMGSSLIVSSKLNSFGTYHLKTNATTVA